MLREIACYCILYPDMSAVETIPNFSAVEIIRCHGKQLEGGIVQCLIKPSIMKAYPCA